jgi:hypothetical protein
MGRIWTHHPHCTLFSYPDCKHFFSSDQLENSLYFKLIYNLYPVSFLASAVSYRSRTM